MCWQEDAMMMMIMMMMMMLMMMLMQTMMSVEDCTDCFGANGYIFLRGGPLDTPALREQSRLCECGQGIAVRGRARDSR